MIGIGDQLVPLGAIDLHRKCIGIEAGTRHHGQNLAVARIHGDNRAIAIAQSEFRRALQIVVDGQLQVLAGHRVLRPEKAHFAAVAVDDHIARAVLPAQHLVVHLFHAGLAHHIARLVGSVARSGSDLFADFAHIADQVRRKSVARIEPPLLFDGLQFRQLVAVGFDESLLIRRDVVLDGNRLIAGGMRDSGAAWPCS